MLYLVPLASLEVLRRTGYKGWHSSETALPVDGATVIGIVVVLGSLLAAPALPNATIEGCSKIFEGIEDKMDLPSSFCLVPRCREFALDLYKNKVQLKIIQEMFRKLEIPWKRPAGFTNRKHDP